jgi:putative component of membrane protein insertase Oxa1/YidC/SpoIIIJ protein YidD
MHCIFNHLPKLNFFLILSGLFLMVSTKGLSLNINLVLEGEDSVLTDTLNTQNPGNDFELMCGHERKNPYPIKKKPGFLLVGKKKIVKYNPVNLLFGGMLFTYQAFISSQISADCPFEVSCSAFSKQSIQEFGLIKGLALSADRLTRCSKSGAKDIHPLRFNKNGSIIDFPFYYRTKSRTKE